ncbi:hypothetical protein ZHAS_00014221 [Anopheles sinensis]|uniref:Uncharacterized protein n=1 Tax=Anopheles sinensis TaxID=74873 RepID=A0A084W7M2_ANOSI|nr:hypothetical protein ZHAS_00014221 [Anopheles sinensis]
MNEIKQISHLAVYFAQALKKERSYGRAFCLSRFPCKSSRVECYSTTTLKNARTLPAPAGASAKAQKYILHVTRSAFHSVLSKQWHRHAAPSVPPVPLWVMLFREKRSFRLQHLGLGRTVCLSIPSLSWERPTGVPSARYEQCGDGPGIGKRL